MQQTRAHQTAVMFIKPSTLPIVKCFIIEMLLKELLLVHVKKINVSSNSCFYVKYINVVN